MFQYQFLQIYHLKIYLLIFVVACGMSSCVKEENVQIQNSIVVDTSLQPYFELFEAEGQLRGQSIDVIAAQIEGQIVDIEAENVVGQCSEYTNSERKILRIDKTYWNKATEMEREFVVFHELGHCYLGRGHVDEKDTFGNCSSMMHSGLSGCRFSYTLTNRTSYLDELFE